MLLLMWLQALGQAPLFDVDEGAFAQASREMLASGDWGHTTLNGAPRFDKPILIYWLQALALMLVGHDVLAVRLPSVLAAWIWCMATWWFVAPRQGKLAASFSTLILATSLGPFAIGRASTADALLNLLLALTLFDLWRWIEVQTPGPKVGPVSSLGANWQGPRAGRSALRRASLWMSLGLLAKGPIAVLIPGCSLALWILWQAAWLSRSAPGSPPGTIIGRARPIEVRAVLRGLTRDPIAWSIPLAVALPWYAYALHRHGEAFIEGFFVRHNLQRFAGVLEGHSGSALYHLLILPVLMLPWSPLLVPMLGRLGALQRDPLNRWLLAWSGFVLIFFSLAGTKLPHYGLYGFTPLAILAGSVLAGVLERQVWISLVALTSACLAALGAYSDRLAVWLARSRSDPYWLAVMDPVHLPPGPSAGWCLVVIAIALLASVAPVCCRPDACRATRPHAILLIAIGAANASLLAQQAIPWWGEALHGPVRPLALMAAEQGLALVQWGVDQPSAGFHRQAVAPRRAPQPGEAVLVRIDRIDSMPRAVGQEAPRLIACERGLCLMRMPPAQPHSP